MSLTLKQKLHQQCIQYVDQRILNIRSVLNNATESANDETKSSAGDKHETGRAMAQLEQEKGAKQLSEALNLRNELLKIDPEKSSLVVSKGSVVITNEGNFYISIAAGKIMIENDIYFAISPESPLASNIAGLLKTQSVSFNNKQYTILSIL